jgi:serine protease Do
MMNMTKRQTVSIILISFVVGAIGSMFFEHFLFPRMAVVPGLSWLSKISASPVVVTRREEIVLNEGANLVELSKQAGNRTVSIYQRTKGYPKLLGSGIILSSDGLLVSSREVVGNNSQLLVVLNDGRSFDGLIRALDPKSELAIITIPARDLSVAEFSDAYSLQTGQKILALGNSNDSYTRKFATGVVTNGVLSGSFERPFSSETLSDVLETDADLENEFVGGPVVGLNGRVLGIVVNSQGKILVSEHVRTATASYLATGKISRPYLGLRYLNLSEAMAKLISLPTAGVLVLETEETSPARKAGLIAGDLIVEMDGEKMDQGFEQLLNKHALTPASLKLYRNERELELTVTLQPTK